MAAILQPSPEHRNASQLSVGFEDEALLLLAHRAEEGFPSLAEVTAIVNSFGPWDGDPIVTQLSIAPQHGPPARFPAFKVKFSYPSERQTALGKLDKYQSNGWKYEAMTYKYICFVSRGNGRMPEIQETPYADRGNKPHESPMTQAIHEGGYEVPSDHPLGPGAQ